MQKMGETKREEEKKKGFSYKIISHDTPLSGPKLEFSFESNQYQSTN